MILDFPPFLATRRNHALEHASLLILARKYKDQNMAGHSNPTGFFLFGDMSLEDIRNAINEAMTRLPPGESGHAIHPRCRTKLAASTLVPSASAWAPFQGARSLRWRLLLIPVALMFAIFGYLLSKPLGPWLQRNVTTEADLGDMRVMDIVTVRPGVYRVLTK